MKRQRQEEEEEEPEMELDFFSLAKSVEDLIEKMEENIKKRY
jgi:hypothetical protein